MAIGPLTNLALLGVERPGVLARADVVMMGGWFDPIFEGLPKWGPSRDWNVQCDTIAARIVVCRAGVLTMVPLSLTLRTFLRRSHLEERRVMPVLDGEVLHFADSDHGRLVHIATDVAADAFAALWLASIENADQLRDCP